MTHRPVLLILPALLATALAWADNRPADPDRARQLQRNLGLIQSLVDGSLLLSSADDPVTRANHCNSLAERLAGEIRTATEDHDGYRVEELGRHLKNLLKEGVASNLSLARGEIPVGSSDERKLQEVRDRTTRLVVLLEEDLRRANRSTAQPEIRKMLEAVQEGRSQVEHAVKSKP